MFFLSTKLQKILDIDKDLGIYYAAENHAFYNIK